MREEPGWLQWFEGDAESLPFPDGQFEVVVSQFGHMFAPRPDVAVAEMRRALVGEWKMAHNRPQTIICAMSELGQNATEMACSCNFGFSIESDRPAYIPDWQLRAKNGLMHRDN